MEGNSTFLKTFGITKQFPGVIALSDVSLEIDAGEVHALLGENGAGKSTLIKVLTGVYTPDKGSVFIDNKEVRISDPHKALQLGISAIFQDPSLVPYMSVEDNIMLGREPRSRVPGFVNKQRVRQHTREILAQVGLDINPQEIVGRLNIGYQQLVAIAKALSVEARLIIMDEPTSSLTKQEIDYLFGIIQDLKSRGISIIYVSHRLEEVFSITDRVSVLRDGIYIGTRTTSKTNTSELINMIVGRDVVLESHNRKPPQNEVALSVRDITRKGAFDKISFEVRRGEVVALNGLVGAGRTDVARAIYGADPPDSGEILVFGESVSFRTPRTAIQAGIGMVPEDRKKQGFVPRLSVTSNTTLASIMNYCKVGFIQAKTERENVAQIVKRLDIKTPTLEQHVALLSGGNQQKVVLAKTLDNDADILILDEPTAGVDIGAKAEIRNLINELAEQGRAILLISSEIPEVLALADRVLVMREGRIVGELSQETATPESIMKLSVGEA